MGKLNQDPQIHHFSHPHPLELSSPQNSPLSQISAPPPPCSACQLLLPSSSAPAGANFFYACKPCNFFLHVSCTQFPQLITHPSHPYHPLTLLPTPTYPGGKFNCDACNRRGGGFSYHCSHCDFDLHVICASKPLSVANPFHPHPLGLTFTSPYTEMKGFSCDVCRKIGSHQWLYRCDPCEFDVHLECANSKPIAPPPPPPLQHHYSFNSTAPQNQGLQQSSMHQMFPGQVSAAPAPVRVDAVLYGNTHLVHSASTGGRLENNYPATSAGVGSPHNSYGGGQFQNNYVPAAGMSRHNSTGGVNFQNNYPLAGMGPNHNGGGVQNIYVPAAGMSRPNSTGGGNFQNNHPIAGMGPNHTGGGVQNNYPVSSMGQNQTVGNNLGNTVMNGLVEGAAQQVGQTLMQNILGGGNDGGGGGGILDAVLGAI